MEPGTDLRKIQTLSVPPADSPLRERQILMLQQALHNAGVHTNPERLRLIELCTGRPVTSLREIRQGELRPVIRYIRNSAAKHLERI